MLRLLEKMIVQAPMGEHGAFLGNSLELCPRAGSRSLVVFCVRVSAGIELIQPQRMCTPEMAQCVAALRSHFSWQVLTQNVLDVY